MLPLLLADFLYKYMPAIGTYSGQTLSPGKTELTQIRSIESSIHEEMLASRTSTVLEFLLNHAQDKGYLLHGSYAIMDIVKPRFEMFDYSIAKGQQRPLVFATSCAAVALWWATINKERLLAQNGRTGTVMYDAETRTFSATYDIVSTRSNGFVYVLPSEPFVPATGSTHKYSSTKKIKPVARISVHKDLDFGYPIGILQPKQRKR